MRIETWNLEVSLIASFRNPQKIESIFGGIFLDRLHEMNFDLFEMNRKLLNCFFVCAYLHHVYISLMINIVIITHHMEADMRNEAVGMVLEERGMWSNIG